MCCSSHGASSTVALQLQAAALPTEPARAPAKKLRYLGQEALSLRGPFSGSVYQLALREEVAVDPSDLQALLRTGLFEAV